MGVTPAATAEAITAAFRRRARVLHPDVPVTGDAQAFVAARRSYDLLVNPQRRAAYDRSGQRPDGHEAIEDDAIGEIPPVPPYVMPAAPVRHPRLSDLPMPLWIGAGLLICLAAAEAAVHLYNADAPVPPTVIAGPARIAARLPEPQPGPSPVATRAPAQIAADPNAYIMPAGGPAIMWRHDPVSDRFEPIGKMVPFTPVRTLHPFRQTGLIEVRTTDGWPALIEAARLTPGDPAAARHAYCVYNAGPPPENGEVLDRRGQGSGTLTVTNRSSEPAVLKLRDEAGLVAASVFLSPGGHAVVANLPIGRYRPDFAVGEMWSRACNTFAAGMRAQRIVTAIPLSGLGAMAIPPDPSDGLPVQDIQDQAFGAK